jgi:hypothetical protein
VNDAGVVKSADKKSDQDLKQELAEDSKRDEQD